MLCGLRFPALVLLSGEPGLELRLLVPQEELCSCDNPPYSQPPHMGDGTTFFTSPPFLPVSVWLLLEILGYKTSTLLVFSWLFRLFIP